MKSLLQKTQPFAIGGIFLFLTGCLPLKATYDNLLDSIAGDILGLNTEWNIVGVAPTNFTAESGNAEIILTWDESTYNGEAAESYRIYWSATDANGQTVSSATSLEATEPPYMHTGLMVDNQYYYSVEAIFSSGKTELSTKATAVPYTQQALWGLNERVTDLVKLDRLLVMSGDFFEVRRLTGGGVFLPDDTAATSFDFQSSLSFDGKVHVIVPHIIDGVVDAWYAGGEFTSVGGLPRSNLARFSADGTVDSWNPGTDGPVYTIALRPDGDMVYVGGKFTYVAQQYHPNLAALNTYSDSIMDIVTNWTPAPDGPVYAIILDGINMYAGGDFDCIRGEAESCESENIVPNLVKLVLSQENPEFGAEYFDETWKPVPNGAVRALAFNQGSSYLYVGGEFECFGDTDCTPGAGMHLAAVNTTMATDINAGGAFDPRPNDFVRAIVLDPTGSIVAIGGDFNCIMQSDNVCAEPADVRSHLAALDAITGAPKTWQPDPTGPVYALSLKGPSILMVGGDFTCFGGNYDCPEPRSYLAAINVDDLDTAEATLLPFRIEIDGPVRAVYGAAIPGEDGGENMGVIAIGGEFSSVTSRDYIDNSRRYVSALELHTGAPSPYVLDPNGIVNAMASDGETLYLGGQFTQILGQTGEDSGGVPTVELLERTHLAAIDLTTGALKTWNPTVVCAATYSQCTDTYTCADPTGEGCLDAGPCCEVSSLALSGQTLYVGGTFSTIGGQSRNYIAAVDTTTDTSNATDWNPDADYEVETMAVSGTTLYAGGKFFVIGGQERPFIAALDTTKDTAMATDWNPQADARVETIVVNGGKVYVGGNFSTIGEQQTSYLAALDPTKNTSNNLSWDPSPNHIVQSIAVFGDTVYFGGYFDAVGSTERSFIAAVDSTTGVLNDFNPALDGPVESILVNGNTIFVGGHFNFLGNSAAQKIVAINALTSTKAE